MSTDDTRPIPSPTDEQQPTVEHEAGERAPDEHVPEERGGRHPLSISYLVAGLVFLGVAASWALRQAGVVDAGDSSWLFPLTLVVVGAIGLVASLASSARRG